MGTVPIFLSVRISLFLWDVRTSLGWTTRGQLIYPTTPRGDLVSRLTGGHDYSAPSAVAQTWWSRGACSRHAATTERSPAGTRRARGYQVPNAVSGYQYQYHVPNAVSGYQRRRPRHLTSLSRCLIQRPQWQHSIVELFNLLLLYYRSTYTWIVWQSLPNKLCSSSNVQFLSGISCSDRAGNVSLLYDAKLYNNLTSF